MKKFTLYPVLSSLFLVSNSYAQTSAPNVDAGSVFRDMQSTMPPPALPSVSQPVVQQRNIVPLGVEDELKTPVKTIQLVGELPEGLAVEPITKILKSRESITRLSELHELAQKIEAYVHSEGFPLVHVSVPNQEIFNGRVRMLAVNGKLDNRLVTIEGKNLRIDEAKLQAYFDELLVDADKGFKRSAFERQMLLMNDLPGIQARLQIKPGEGPGLVNANLQVEEGPLFTGYAKLDNFGTNETGLYRLTTGFYWNDISGVGDLLGLTLIGTNNNMYVGKLDYQRPFGANGLVGNLSALYSNYLISGALTALGIKGSTQSYEGGLTYPLIREYKQNLYANFNIANRRFATEMAGMESEVKDLQVGRIGLRGDRSDIFAGGGAFYGNIYAYSGVVRPVQGMIFNENQNYDKFTFALARNQNVTNGLTLYGSWSGQRTRYLLDSSELFVLGGISGVRAYSPTAIAAENADLFTVELRKELGMVSDFGNMQATLFYDNGIAYKDPQTAARNQIQGAGLALTLTKMGRYQFMGGYARRIGTSTYGYLPDDLSNSGRFWASLLVQF